MKPIDNEVQEQRPLTTRRPSVLVAAGTETRLDSSPNFLASALRRLSSSNAVTLSKHTPSRGAVGPRRIMNIDQNRQRSKIQEFDQNRLRRVAFKVDVEIAGISAQADEQQEVSTAASSGESNKGAKMAKYKDRSEGAALKKSQGQEEGATAQPETQRSLAEPEVGAIKAEINAEIAIEKQKDNDETPAEGEKPTTRKKEKKKRSEAERKERKERKRRHAEANGLVPLELVVDDDSDSSNQTPPGASTPKRAQPTIDPLRIYKRCCALRETNIMATVKEQISKPSAVLSEAPGTVASVDLSGNEMSLADVQTLGDWLAVVPVRRLILDDCNLSDEAVRIILSGLSGCKSQEQARLNRKLPRHGTGELGTEQMGVIEKLSMKNNTAISTIGWRHIALFMHMCRSLRGLDLSGIPFPSIASAESQKLGLTRVTSLSNSQELPPKHVNPSTLFARALAERFGDRLEELILSGCVLETHAVGEIVDSVIKCKVKRLGLAHNDLDADAVEHIVRYVSSGVCEGLDMGGNNLQGAGHLLTQVLDESNPLFAMSLADCNLTVQDLRAVLEHVSQLRNFKFIDLSRNQALFGSSKDAVSVLRKRLPALKELKRIHLSNTDMNPDQLISLCEILPDVPSLAHVSVLENRKLIDCMNSNKGESQEEACAVFVSLMSAVRASKTLVAVEIEVPSHESSEVVKALASQVVAYSLRNLERTTLSDYLDRSVMPERLDKQAPEVLLHLVGHMDGYSENHDNDEPAPDEDYMIASTGIVKALDVCLDNEERLASHNASPTASGTTTPRRIDPLQPQGVKKPKDVSLELCESARKIRLRLRPAMVKEDRAGNTDAYRKFHTFLSNCHTDERFSGRLVALDQTLERIIRRFEDEYPQSRRAPSPSMQSLDSRNSSYIESQIPDNLSLITSNSETIQRTFSNEEDPHSLQFPRKNSDASLAARVLMQEEGRMHRFGQHMRREILKPTGTDDVLHGTSVYDEPEPEHMTTFRSRLENLGGDFIRKEVEAKGTDNVLRELGINMQELRVLQQEDPEAFANLRDSQLAAQLNSRLSDSQSTQEVKQPVRGHISIYDDVTK